MRISDADRCPKCGTPYLSMLEPGATEDNRYCYTCETQAADARMTAKLHAAANANVDDDLELQPLEESADARKNFKKGAPRRGNLRQQMMSDVRNKAQKERMAERAARRREQAASAVPKTAPAGTEAGPTPAGEDVGEQGQTAETAAEQEASPAPTEAEPLPAPAAARKSASGLAPARASRSGRQTQAPSPVKKYATLGAAGVGALIAAIVLWKTLGGAPPSVTPSASSASAAPAPSPVAQTAPAPPPAGESRKAAPERAAVPDAALPSVPKAETAQADAEKKPDSPATAPADSTGGVIGPLEKRRPRAASDDDEPETPAPKKKPEGTPAPAQAGADPPPETPAPKTTLADLVEKKKPDSDGDAARAAKPPAAPIVITVTEPTLAPVDFNRLGEGSDKNFTQQLSAYCPGWTVRDTLQETSKIGIDHRGGKQAAILNPINEKLPAKLMATLDIPANFGALRPRLRFEVSTKESNKTWLLTVKTNNQALIERQQIKSSKDAPWMDMAVPLAGFAGKRVEIVLECWTLQKDGNKRKDDLCCFKNLRLEWDRKK